jgi:lysozyme family protein
MAFTFSAQLSTEYRLLFDSCVIDPKKQADVDACVDRIVKNKLRYEALTGKVGLPWYFTGILHNMEVSCNFNTHLHNGDPLTARTVQKPAGCPKTGNPPFIWESSAEDALRIKKFDTWTDWSISGMLYKMELYNGIGYRIHGIHTPYLWSGSNHYTKGKFVKDSFYDPNAVSKQIGGAVLLRRRWKNNLLLQERMI